MDTGVIFSLEKEQLPIDIRQRKSRPGLGSAVIFCSQRDRFCNFWCRCRIVTTAPRQPGKLAMWRIGTKMYKWDGAMLYIANMRYSSADSNDLKPMSSANDKTNKMAN